ncbi:DUF3093 domain-containing protein [Propionibacteriaceae bacterium Y1923]|uniref:DUF3093 domain-containing protein n=1 Tax=Aestuariimicrobium sp. Y1814 TaxID=3418742 RepID=UPI003C201DE9
MSSTPPEAPHHDERLTVPVMWWVVLLFLALTFVVAVWAILDDAWALSTLVVSFGLVTMFLVSYGRPRVRTTDAGLEAGGASIEWRYLSGATALDVAQSREALAVAAGGGSWMLVRPYLTRYVRVDLADPADPYRHWLLSSRDPRHLAAAITRRCNAEQVVHD